MVLVWVEEMEVDWEVVSKTRAISHSCRSRTSEIKIHSKNLFWHHQ